MRLDTQDARSRDRNPSNFTLDCVSDHSATKRTTNFKVFLFLETAAAAFVYIFLYPIGYQSAQFFRRALHYASGGRQFLRQRAQPPWGSIYCHPQTDCFVLSELFSVARHTERYACVCVCVCVRRIIRKKAVPTVQIGSSISSTETANDTRLTKAWTPIDKLSIIWKSDLIDKMKRSFFQAAVVSILLYGCTTWTLTKRLEKKLDDNYTRMLRAILNKSWRQHPTTHPLYGHLAPITKTIQVRRTRHAEHCWRSRDELISDVLL